MLGESFKVIFRGYCSSHQQWSFEHCWFFEQVSSFETCVRNIRRIFRNHLSKDKDPSYKSIFRSHPSKSLFETQQGSFEPCWSFEQILIFRTGCIFQFISVFALNSLWCVGLVLILDQDELYKSMGLESGLTNQSRVSHCCRLGKEYDSTTINQSKSMGFGIQSKSKHSKSFD